MGRIAREGAAGQAQEGTGRAVLANEGASGSNILEGPQLSRRAALEKTSRWLRRGLQQQSLHPPYQTRTQTRKGPETHRKPWLCVFELSHYSGFPAPNLSEFYSDKNLCTNPPPPPPYAILLRVKEVSSLSSKYTFLWLEN